MITIGTLIGVKLRGRDVCIGDVLIGKLVLGQVHYNKLEIVYLSKQVNQGYAHLFGVCVKNLNKDETEPKCYFKNGVYKQFYPDMIGSFKHSAKYTLSCTFLCIW